MFGFARLGVGTVLRWPVNPWSGTFGQGQNGMLDLWTRMREKSFAIDGGRRAKVTLGVIGSLAVKKTAVGNTKPTCIP